MGKIIYLIPGFGEQIYEENYQFLVSFLKKKDITVIPISIRRKNRTMSDYVQECIKQINKHTIDDTIYTLGFSFGAVISFIISSKTNIIYTQYLCSLSPWFKEDLSTIKKRGKKYMGIRRMLDFKGISCDDLCKNIKCKTYVLYGTEEGLNIKNRAENVNKIIKNSTLISIPGAKHDISQDIYRNHIELLLSKSFLS